VEEDILKITNVNRYSEKDKDGEIIKPAVALIHNIGIKSGAIAISVNHDSHNIIACGVDDKDICKAVNEIIKHKGGVVVIEGNDIEFLPLPIGGIMSDLPCDTIGPLYGRMIKRVKKMGTKLYDPYMTLSFMALLVIPSFKLSDKGLFDVSCFKFVDVVIGNSES
jgi:adenine deaminase